MAEAMIRLEGIHKRFGDLEVLKGIDLEVGKGEVICILGPSGSGKSTLLRCVNLLEPPEEGEIFLEGQDICKGPGSGTGEESWNVDFVRQVVLVVVVVAHAGDSATSISSPRCDVFMIVALRVEDGHRRALTSTAGSLLAALFDEDGLVESPAELQPAREQLKK